MIILGDFGLFFKPEQSNTEKYWLNWLNHKPYTVMFVDGNHENFDIINNFEESNKFGECGYVGITPFENIFHIKRGSILEIDNKKLFVFGGGLSIDKERRIERLSWWKEEIPNYQEIENALNCLEKHDYKVDYVLTHAVFKEAYIQMFNLQNLKIFDHPKYKDPLIDMLQEFKEKITYTWWYCGHYHFDITIPSMKTTCMYNDKPKELI